MKSEEAPDWNYLYRGEKKIDEVLIGLLILTQRTSQRATCKRLITEGIILSDMKRFTWLNIDVYITKERDARFSRRVFI